MLEDERIDLGGVGDRRHMAGIGDGGLGPQPAVGQLQQADAPGVGIAVLLEAEQVAIGRGGIDPDQHRVAGLVDLVMSADADSRMDEARIVGAAAVCEVLKSAESKIAAAAVLSGARLPVEPLQPFAIKALDEAGHQHAIYDGFKGEPKANDIDTAAALALKSGAKAVVGLGGGSALAVAAAAAKEAESDQR